MKENQNFAEKTLTKESIFDGVILHVRKDTAQTVDGEIVTREVVEHPGGVGIAMEDDDGTFFLVSQWRYAQSVVTLEFPAGKREKGEDPLTTGKREVIEETGYEGKDWYYLGHIFPTPAYDTEIIDLYYARKGAFCGQHFDRDEHIQLKKYTLDELTEMVVHQEISDSKTVYMTLLIRELKTRKIL